MWIETLSSIACIIDDDETRQCDEMNCGCLSVSCVRDAINCCFSSIFHPKIICTHTIHTDVYRPKMKIKRSIFSPVYRHRRNVYVLLRHKLIVNFVSPTNMTFSLYVYIPVRFSEHYGFCGCKHFNGSASLQCRLIIIIILIHHKFSCMLESLWMSRE